MNKKQKRNLGIGIVLVLALIFLVNLNNLSIVGTNANTKLINSQITDDYIRMDIAWDNKLYQSIGCGEIKKIDGRITWNTQNIGKSKGLYVESTYNSNVPQWITSLGKGRITLVSVNGKTLKNSYGTCDIGYTNEVIDHYSDSTGYTYERKWYIYPKNCQFSGELDLIDNVGCVASSEGYYMNFDDNGKLTIYFPKDPSVECLDDSWCDFGDVCSNKKCVYSPKEIMVYRFEDNECSLRNILETEKQENDFNSLSDCQENIELPKVFYRFEENLCNKIEILESEKTNKDYTSLEECELNIEETTIIEDVVEEIDDVVEDVKENKIGVGVAIFLIILIIGGIWFLRRK